MSRNLEEKIGLILNEAGNRSRSETVRLFKQLIESETKLSKGEFVLGEQDLFDIRALAITNYNNSRASDYGIDDPDHFRTLSYTFAVCAYLKSAEVVQNDFIFEKNKKRYR
jgi:hypothetical protein